jgi:hypothetical protein
VLAESAANGESLTITSFAANCLLSGCGTFSSRGVESTAWCAEEEGVLARETVGAKREAVTMTDNNPASPLDRRSGFMNAFSLSGLP